MVQVLRMLEPGIKITGTVRDDNKKRYAEDMATTLP